MPCVTCNEDKPLVYKNKTQCQACYRREKRRERGLRKPGRPAGEPRTHCSKGHELDAANTLIVGKRRRCRLCFRESSLLRIYDLTPEQYAQMLEAQDGKCAICRHEFTGENRDTNVDHCHKTGKVRGILCPDCNRGLGLFRDDPVLLQRALEYV